MPTTRKVQNPIERYRRFETARSRILLWESLLSDAYKYAIPNKRDFETVSPGNSKFNDIFDSTAVLGVNAFANNIQSILMPPFRRWAKLVPGSAIQENNKEAVQLQLQEINHIFFKYLDQSNFAQSINESLQDLAIGTGILLFNEGPRENPFQFTSIPMSRVAFEEGAHNELENFWRWTQVPLRQIKRLWPMAQLTPTLEKQLANSPDMTIEIIEGTILYPENSDNSKYFYYVMESHTKTDLYTEFREFSPWIGFRFSKAPGEIVGRGPVLTALPDIRTVNKMREFMLRSAKLQAFPVYLAASTSVINPFNLNIEPGAIIPIEPQFVGSNPISPLPTSGNVQIGLTEIQALQASIREILFANPLPPMSSPTQTATEISIRQQNWIRESGASFGRLTVELLEPIMKTGLTILRKKGLIQDIKIDGKEIALQYESPLLEIQSQEDVQRAQQWLQLMQSLYGQAAILAFKPEEFPYWAAEKMNVDLKLLPSSDVISNVLNELQERVKAQVEGPQAPQVPTPTPGELPTVSPFVQSIS
jgi:hypothetical protein